jgi:dihydroflavonol-4-reductase
VRVAVTGGSGVVGLPLVRQLVEAGHEVRALARSDLAASRLAGRGASPVIGDVLDSESLTRLVEGAGWVFHVAGLNQICPVDPGAMWRVNVEGTRKVMDACRRAGVGRLVHTSSAVTIGERDGEVGTEATNHRGSYLSRYERTKTEAERMLLAEADGLDVVVVNPSSVQGPGRATGTGRLLLNAARGRPPLLYDATFSMVDIADCARGHLLAAEQGRTGERYLLSGSTMTTRGLLARLTAITGRRYRPRFLGPAALSTAGWAAGGVYALVGGQAPLCPEAVRVIRHRHSYDGSRATRELGLSYTSVEDTLTRTIDWFTNEGMLA